AKRGTRTKRSDAKSRATSKVIQEVLSASKGDLRAALPRVETLLAPAALGVAFVTVEYAGRDADENGWVSISYVGGSQFSYSIWPEWAYGVAEGALHFGKQLLLVFPANEVASGGNLTLALCER